MATTSDGPARLMRVLTPYPHVMAFYDGRIAGHRFAEGPNWIDDGALSLGIASYAIRIGREAIVFDTHVTLDHARCIRKLLEDDGVTRMTVVLSHWHLDHIAGNAAFSDCEIIATRRTAEHMARRRAEIESGTLEGPPGIDPLVMPTRLYDGRLTLRLGQADVELIEVNIHSDDATVIWLPQHRILLAGDTMEDTVTYVSEPESLDTHLEELDRLWRLAPRRILPAHGSPDIIAGGGYGKTLIRATQQYIRVLKRCAAEPEKRNRPLADLIAGPLDMGWVTYHPGYEAVHQANIALVSAGADAKV
ncbi:MAG: MBL fold metallo-hydrolase [Hyphomicrobium sp.]